MFDIKICDLDESKYKELTRVICVAKYKDDFVFSYNKNRNGWEIPGGHIEENESWEEAAKREMYEETGATDIEVEPISLYKISTYGMICYCKIKELGDLPKEFEMEKIMFTKELPDNLTFPESSKIFFETVINKKGL